MQLFFINLDKTVPEFLRKCTIYLDLAQESITSEGEGMAYYYLYIYINCFLQLLFE